MILPLLALSDPALTRLPSRDYIKRRIRKLCQGKDIAQVPNDPNFPAVPVYLSNTPRHDQFLRCDTGTGMQLNIFSYIAIDFFCEFL